MAHRSRARLLPLLAFLAPPALAMEPLPVVAPLWLDPGVSAACGAAVPWPLSLPPGWAPGDAAAVVLAAGDAAARRQPPAETPLAETPPAETPPAEIPLAEALLAEGAAVLELAPRPGRDLAGEVLCALAVLRRDAGAGLVVALGEGATAGGAALRAAAEEARAAALLGPQGPRLAAGAALGPGRPGFAPRFALGAAPAPEEGWPIRAPLLCAALARVLGWAAALERECNAALVPAAGAARAAAR